MIFKITGIERMDYKFDDGKELKAVKLYGIHVDKISDHLKGEAVDSFMIPDDSNLVFSGMLPELVIGRTYAVGFDKGSKKVGFMMSYAEPEKPNKTA